MGGAATALLRPLSQRRLVVPARAVAQVAGHGHGRAKGEVEFGVACGGRQSEALAIGGRPGDREQEGVFAVPGPVVAHDADRTGVRPRTGASGDVGLLGEAQIASDHVGDRFGFGDLANAAGGDRQGGVVVVPRRARNAGSGSMRRRRGEGGVGEAEASPQSCSSAEMVPSAASVEAADGEPARGGAPASAAARGL